MVFLAEDSDPKRTAFEALKNSELLMLGKYLNLYVTISIQLSTHLNKHHEYGHMSQYAKYIGLKTVTCRCMKCIHFKLSLEAEHIISIKELNTYLFTRLIISNSKIHYCILSLIIITFKYTNSNIKPYFTFKK